MKTSLTDQDRQTKWRDAFTRFAGWDTKEQRRVQAQEANVMAAWLLALNLTHYDILEVGCGNGYFGQIVIERLSAANVDFTYHFSDLLPECVEKTKQTMATYSQPEKLLFSQFDVYQIDTVLPTDSQHIILSTGFVSPVTYKDAVPKVAKVLQPGGILICDFINHLSPLVVATRPLSTIKDWLHAWRKQPATVSQNDFAYFGRFGLRKFYSSHGLNLQRHRTIRWRRNPIIAMFKKQ